MKKVLLFTLGFAMIAISVFVTVDGNKNYYNPKGSFLNTKQMYSMKGLEMLYTMKANQLTGVINPADVAMAKDQINKMRLNKAGFPLVWQETGPDNIGGRCRIILIDKDNPNILYAAGVSGGIFKSTNAAGSWTAVNDALSTLVFQSGCQTPNGDIYFGSGENTGSFGGSGDNEGSAFPGEGIFKSVDGAKTFTQLSTTTSFSLVNAMSSDPKKNIAYAGTNTHLKYSDDGGATWKNVFTGPCRDVKVANNGNVVAYMGSKIYYSTTGTVNGSYVAATGIPGGFNRMVISISPQDPDYVYVLASQANNFGGLFRSKDGGKTFTTVVPGGSTIFNPLNGGAGGQGDYDLVVGVHPRDKNKVFMGGVQMAEWTETKGPIEVFNGTHADHHWFAFDTVSSPMRMYNGNDGGVYRSTNEKFNFFSANNIGFNVTQFYGIAGNADGDVIGGTQDNGTVYISKKGTEKMRGVQIYGGDGFRTEISNVNRSAFIVESYYGNIARSQNKGTGTGSILDKRVPRFKLNANGGLEADPKGSYIQAPFNTSIKLSEVQDTIFRLFVGATESIWMVEHVINSTKNPTWFKVSQTSNVHVIESSSDGKYIFAGKSGSLVRITLPVDANDKLFHFDTLNNLNSTQVYPGVKTDQIFGNLPPGRFITGIGVDQANPNRVIVTLGNYGNANFVYYSENALSTVPTWTNIQGNLPAMPVYDAEFVYDNPNMVLIGTEFGIYGTTNVTSGSVNWVEQNQGFSASKPFPKVAAYELRQIENKPGDIGSVILAGTHGRGIFETKTLFTGIKNADGTLPLKLHVFPNPVSDNATVQFSVTQKDNLMVRVMSISGKVVYEKQLNAENRGTKTIKIDTDNFVNGTYIVSITGNSHKGASKIIVQK